MLTILSPPGHSLFFQTLGAVQSCTTAGITVRMVTGDHPQTASFIAKEVDILRKEHEANRSQLVMTAHQFDNMPGRLP